VNALRDFNLSDTVARLMIESLPDRARRRVREELDRKGVTQPDIAGQLQWSQSKVAQKLTGRTPWTLQELESLCFVAGLSPIEAIRDQGLEFCTDMTPTEFRLFERLRQLTPSQLDAVIVLIDVASNTRAQERRAAAPRPKRGPRNR